MSLVSLLSFIVLYSELNVFHTTMSLSVSLFPPARPTNKESCWELSADQVACVSRCSQSSSSLCGVNKVIVTPAFFFFFFPISLKSHSCCGSLLSWNDHTGSVLVSHCHGRGWLGTSLEFV